MREKIPHSSKLDQIVWVLNRNRKQSKKSQQEIEIKIFSNQKAKLNNKMTN